MFSDMSLKKTRSANHPSLEGRGSSQTKKCVREMRKRAARRKSQTEASATNESSKVPQLGKFEVRQFILREYVKDPDHLYSIASQSSLNGNNDLAKYCVNQNRKPIDDLFESTSRLVSEERRGIPKIEVIRDTLRGECVEGCN